MSLRMQALKAAAWLTAGTAVAQGVSYGATLLLAWFLSPEELGKAAIGMLVVASAGLLREMGIGRALIYIKNRIEEAADTGFYLIPAVTVALYLIVLASAGWVGAFFRDADVPALVRVMALTLVINAFGEVPSALFEKQLAFDRKTLAEIAGLTAYGIAVVALAAAGFSFWSVAYASLISAALNVAVLWRLSPWRPRWRFDAALAKELLRYGHRVVESTIVNFGIRNIDDAVVGRMLGAAPLGVYNLAYRIANLPATTMAPVIGRVMFPVYNQLAAHAFDLRNAFLKALKLTAFVTVPVGLEIYLLTPHALTVFFDHKWDAAAQPIRILILYGVIRSLSSGMGGIFMALNRVRTMTKISLGQFFILLIFLYPAVHFYGLIGVCWLSTVAMAYSAVTHCIAMRPLIALRYRALIQTLWRSATASLITAGLVYAGCRRFVPPDTMAFLTLQAGLAALLYAALMMGLDRETRTIAAGLFNRLRRRRGV